MTYKRIDFKQIAVGNLDQQNWWDEQSCAEFEAFLDEMHDDAQEPAEPPCTCYYTDVDVVENRYCEAHGRF